MEKSHKGFLMFLVLALNFLSACSIHQPVARHAVDFNRALEETQNKVIFLNVIRASKRHPMHYSALTQIAITASSSVGPSLSLTLPLPFKEDANGSITPGLSAQFNRGSFTATVGTLDTQEFYQGILSPISVDQLAFFLEQGWNVELLLTLLIEQMILCEGGKQYVYTNDPGEGFDKITEFIERVRETDFKIEETKIDVGLPFEADSKDLPGLAIEAKEAGWELQRVEGEDAKNMYKFVKGVREMKYKGRKGGYKTLEDPESEKVETRGADSKSSDTNKCQKSDITLRSPQSVIVYLGELLRHQEEGNPQPRIKVSDNKYDAALFFAEKGKSGDAVLSVEYEGEWYSILSDTSFEKKYKKYNIKQRSMQAISLALQLIGLNRSRKDLPATGIITTVPVGGN